MKLRMIMGLLLAGSLLAGSLFVGTAIQAQDLSRIVAVSVECSGGCDDNTLGEICSHAGAGFIPIAVDCRDVQDDTATEEVCGGASDNQCSERTLLSSDALTEYCVDTQGWDAHVYCVAP